MFSIRGWPVILLSILIPFVALYTRLIEAHGSDWKFIATNWSFRAYVFINRCLIFIGLKTKQHSCSLELETMDHIFRQYAKPDYTNHDITTAKKLLTQTRQGRAGFLKITLPPIWDAANNKFENETIAGTKVLWLNKDRMSKGIIISLHGGAYISGSAESCLPYLLPLTYYTQMAGLSINYSLSPEVILPHQTNEVSQIYKYLMNEMKISNENIIFVGDSAGASLIILMIQRLIKDKALNELPLCAVTMSSWDVPSNGESYGKNRMTDSLMDDKTGQVWGHFAVGNLDFDGMILEKNMKKFQKNMNDNADASYLHQDSLWTFEKFPPLFMSVSEWECVLDDSLRVKEQMDKYKDKDKECTLHVTKGTGIHVLEDFYGHNIPEAEILIQREAQWILKQYNKCNTK